MLGTQRQVYSSVTLLVCEILNIYPIEIGNNDGYLREGSVWTRVWGLECSEETAHPWVLKYNNTRHKILLSLAQKDRCITLMYFILPKGTRKYFFVCVWKYSSVGKLVAANQEALSVFNGTQ